mmetsp:Transcript_56309/g.158712  ORF Transcript_56309/g.158712 Transcript_56309/m.158712 type:complete len:245 (-) Transcript_56309:1009-1743(-)
MQQGCRGPYHPFNASTAAAATSAPGHSGAPPDSASDPHSSHVSTTLAVRWRAAAWSSMSFWMFSHLQSFGKHFERRTSKPWTSLVMLTVIWSSSHVLPCPADSFSFSGSASSSFSSSLSLVLHVSLIWVRPASPSLVSVPTGTHVTFTSASSCTCFAFAASSALMFSHLHSSAGKHFESSCSMPWTSLLSSTAIWPSLHVRLWPTSWDSPPSFSSSASRTSRASPHSALMCWKVWFSLAARPMK